MKEHPNRKYNLYLCNYYSYLAQKKLKHLLEEDGQHIPTWLMPKLKDIQAQIRPLHEVEKIS